MTPDPRVPVLDQRVEQRRGRLLLQPGLVRERAAARRAAARAFEGTADLDTRLLEAGGTEPSRGPPAEGRCAAFVFQALQQGAVTVTGHKARARLTQRERQSLERIAARERGQALDVRGARAVLPRPRFD